MREMETEVDLESEMEQEFTPGRWSNPSCDILNLGCGDDYRANAWNVDHNPVVEPDEVVDLNDAPWPWFDGSFQRVDARHVLEHLSPVPWGEIVRVLAPGGTLRWTYPIGHTRFEDPTHRQFWNWNTAEAMTGDRAHSHQFADGLRLVDRQLRWSVSGRPFRLYTWARLNRSGPGPWLSQVPGLSGDVTAIYRRKR